MSQLMDMSSIELEAMTPPVQNVLDVSPA
jgi:hypothetical protein